MTGNVFGKRQQLAPRLQDVEELRPTTLPRSASCAGTARREVAGPERVEDRVAVHQTGHNSGVVHAGIYYQPGSLKAQLCSRGGALLREYCAERALPYDECGKLVVAVEESELGRLDALEAKAQRNGVPGLRRVAGSGITEVEPHAAGLVALHSPATAITDAPRARTSWMFETIFG